jgi:hypothetical protein
LRAAWCDALSHAAEQKFAWSGACQPDDKTIDQLPKVEAKLCDRFGIH